MCLEPNKCFTNCYLSLVWNLANLNDATDLTDTNPIVCPHWRREEHSRITHRNCAGNPVYLETNSVDAVDDTVNLTPVICPYCERDGHLRITHRSCRRNSINNSALSVEFLRDLSLPETSRQNMGAMDGLCASCGASMLVAERKTNSSASNPIVQMCCAAGQAMVAPLQPLPATIVNYLTRDDEAGREVMNV
ncbi:hypothetical protein [Parasitella parasitica]|uniref:Uncharacterized protein n=1 Tax=Parasitella parasitica TaxID=35722 RepID=A0A0B7NTG8_9FUNG|nr:hypothetical protein [Parasitella parasitica]